MHIAEVRTASALHLRMMPAACCCLPIAPLWDMLRCKESTSGDTREADYPSTDSNASVAASVAALRPKKRSKAHCVLLYGSDLSDDAAQRLKTLRATRDGFLIAERDLALRGPGEVLGVRQKGYLEGR